MPGSLQFQGSYSFSKVLTDSGGRPNPYESFLDVNNAKIERARAPFDMTHGIKVNAIYDLPLGRGHLVNFRPLEPVTEWLGYKWWPDVAIRRPVQRPFRARYAFSWISIVCEHPGEITALSTSRSCFHARF